MNRILFNCLIVYFFNIASLSAQEAVPVSPSEMPSNELSVHFGGGLSTLNYRLSQGEPSQGTGITAGADYTYFFSRHFGVSAGLGWSLFNASARLNDAHSLIPNMRDDDGDTYDLHTMLVDYRERQQVSFLRIPLMLRYGNTGRRSLYAQAGIGLYIPLSAEYKTNNAVIYNEAYYPDYNVTLNTPSYQGLGEFTGRNAAGKPGLKITATASAETGVRWQLNNPSLALYTGLYVDYGLTDVVESHNDNMLLYNESSPADFSISSVLTSHSEPSHAFTDKVSLLAAGIKIRLAFGMQGKPSQPAEIRPDPAVLAEAQRRQAEAEAEMQRKQAEAEAIAAQRQAIEAQRQRAEAEAQRQEALFIADVKELEKPAAGFRSNQTTLTPEQTIELDKKVAILKARPELSVVCEGHTCDLGTEEINREIGLRRAETAKKYLIEQGIAESRIEVVNKADTEPLVPNTSIPNRMKNRRVVVRIYE
jgi:outer membrane protein OmpA-like peptidoglycan-associated protein